MSFWHSSGSTRTMAMNPCSVMAFMGDKRYIYKKYMGFLGNHSPTVGQYLVLICRFRKQTRTVIYHRIWL